MTEVTPQTLLADDLNKRSFLCEIIKRYIPTIDFDIIWNASAKLTRDDYRRLLAIHYRRPNEFVSAVKNKLKV